MSQGGYGIRFHWRQASCGPDVPDELRECHSRSSRVPEGADLLIHRVFQTRLEAWRDWRTRVCGKRDSIGVECRRFANLALEPAK